MKLEISFIDPYLREVLKTMPTRQDLENAKAELKETIVKETAEAQEVIKAAVTKAIAPLEAQVADLQARLQLAEPIDFAQEIADVREAIDGVKAIVTPEVAPAPVEEPVEPSPDVPVEEPSF